MYQYNTFCDGAVGRVEGGGGIHLIEFHWQTALGKSVSVIAVLLLICIAVACNSGCLLRTWHSLRRMWSRGIRREPVSCNSCHGDRAGYADSKERMRGSETNRVGWTNSSEESTNIMSLAERREDRKSILSLD